MALLSFLLLIVALPVTILLTNHQIAVQSHAATTPPTPVGVAGSWTLVFDDEFDGTSLDLTKWYPSRTDSISEPYNSDEYAAYDPAQNKLSNGVLQETLTNSSVTVGGKTYKYRTGNIMSRNFKFGYGVLEARIYLPPAGNGQIANWPAWWASGDNWPSDGEIDIMEGLSGSACRHYYYPNGDPGGCPSGNYTGWHVFSVDREPTFLKYYYDGVLVGTVTNGLTSARMRIIAGNQVGRWGGPLLVPTTMQIDYIRVWQPCTTGCSATPTPTGTPIPISGNLIQNSCFSNTSSSWLSPWFFQVHSGAAGDTAQGTYYHINCPSSARVDISTANSTAWYIQLGQANVPLTAGRRYTLSFYAMATKARSFTVALQQAVWPWTVYWQQTPSITSGYQWQKFTFSFTPTVSYANTQLIFNVANTTGRIWFDAVSLQ